MRSNVYEYLRSEHWNSRLKRCNAALDTFFTLAGKPQGSVYPDPLPFLRSLTYSLAMAHRGSDLSVHHE